MSNNFDIGGNVDEFASMPARLVGERAERLARAGKRLHFCVAFLDDYLRGILPNDLVLIGAPSGVGKTDLALNIATSNAYNNRKVNYFALEAEPRELERRTKYALLSRRCFEDRHPMRESLNYTDWLLGKLEHIVAPYDAWADDQVLKLLGGMHTYYRGAKFTAADLQKGIMSVAGRAELIIVDHLHYVDADSADESENKAQADTVKTIRDTSLRIGTPVILVVHLRKRDSRVRQLAADLDDVHGSSNITKISTQVVTLARAEDIPQPKWYLSPTFMAIPKDRRSGRAPLTALCNYDLRTKSYSSHYALGRNVRGEWEQTPQGDVPSWARNHRSVEQPTDPRTP